jgi:hypothetical protein
MKLFVHRKTVRYTDFGDLLGADHGLAWSTTGKAQDAAGFELGEFERLLASKRDHDFVRDGRIEIEIGEPVSRTCDMNPHGLV